MNNLKKIKISIKTKSCKLKANDGFGLLEIIITIFILSTAIFSISQLAIYTMQKVQEGENTAKAIFLAKEGIEATRAIKDKNWTNNIANLNFGADYHPTISSNTWTLASSQEIINQFTRKIIIDNVSRNPITKDIEQTYNALNNDANTKKITSTVLWGTAEIQDISYTNGLTDADLISFPSNSGWGDPGQSFTIGASNIQASKIELYLKKIGAPSNIYLEIRQTSTVGPIIATSNTLTNVDLSSSLSWTAFNFGTVPTLLANTKYYLRLRSTLDSGIPFSGAQTAIYWGYDFPSSYSGGDVYRYINQNNGGGAGQILAQYDFNFKIYRQITGAKNITFTAYITNLLGN